MMSPNGSAIASSSRPRPDRHEGADPDRRGLDVETELPARGETLQPAAGAVAHDGPEPRQRLDPVAQELADGHDVVRPGRAGRGGHRQPGSLHNEVFATSYVQEPTTETWFDSRYP